MDFHMPFMFSMSMIPMENVSITKTYEKSYIAENMVLEIGSGVVYIFTERGDDPLKSVQKCRLGFS